MLIYVQPLRTAEFEALVSVTRSNLRVGQELAVEPVLDLEMKMGQDLEVQIIQIQVPPLQ